MSARAWTLFAAVSVIWGMPYLFIKIAVDEISPSLVAWSRLAIAAAVLLPVAWKLGALRGLGARWRILTVFAAVEMAVPWPLLGFGEVHVSSSLAAILIAAVPLFVALLATRFDHAERPTPTRLVGMLIGLGGVAALVGIDIGGKGDELLGALAILVRRLPVRDRADDREAPALGRGPARPGGGVARHRRAARHAVRAGRACRTRRPPPTRSRRWSCWACSARRSPSCSSSA